MSALRNVLFDLLFNATLQAALFAVIVFAFAPLVAKARAKHQHVFYLLVLALCLAGPCFGTYLRPRASAAVQQQQQTASQDVVSRGHFLWSWVAHSNAALSVKPAAEVESIAICIWALLTLFHVVRFGRAVRRVHRLRRGAVALSPVETVTARAAVSLPPTVLVLQASSIFEPVTIGFVRPAIIFPSSLLPVLSAREIEAVLAHECAHVQRNDFLTHTLCEALSLPIAWHPGVRYVLSQISQTRELACDENAARQFPEGRVYARALVRLASLCLSASRGTAVGVGFFNADNLEARVMKLTEKNTSLKRAGLAILAFVLMVVFGSGAAVARAVSLQTPGSAPSAQSFAGTWHWVFKGRSFVTMVLVPSGPGFSGTVTGSKIALADDGELSKADPTDENAPSPIAKGVVEGNVLHVTVMDAGQPFKFLVTLRDETHAEVHPIGAPANMKPIQAERVR